MDNVLRDMECVSDVFALFLRGSLPLKKILTNGSEVEGGGRGCINCMFRFLTALGSPGCSDGRAVSGQYNNCVINYFVLNS